MNNKGTWLYLGGALLAVISVILGNALQGELRTLPMDQVVQQRDLTTLKFLGFAFGFPLGIGLTVIGSLLRSETSASRLFLFLAPVIATVVAALVVPSLAGRELDGWFFATGGYLILVMVLGLVWLWGQYRSGLQPKYRGAADLQGLGYLCFALAAWNLCGAATMPSFLLEPVMLATMNSLAFATGQMKTVMALFVLGWLFSLIGLWLRVISDRA
jgi:hypothetical protein